MSNEKHCISINDVYGPGWIEKHRAELDERFDWDFRPPKKWEHFSSTYDLSGVNVVSDPVDYPGDAPRIVLSAKDPIKTVYGKTKDQIRFDSRYELTGEFRPPTDQDTYVSQGCKNNGENTVLSGCPWSGNRLILRLKTRRLKEVYDTSTVTIPARYQWTGEFREPKVGDILLTVHGDASEFWDGYKLDDSKPNNRLILKPSKPKVYYKVEAEPRLPKEGESFWAEDRWLVAQLDFKEHRYLCGTRHEEVDSTRQVVTQADIDKLVK